MLRTLVRRLRKLLPQVQGPADSGAALILTLLVMVVVGGLATSITVMTVNNLQSASLARSGGVAVDAADAGIAEAVAYLRSNSLNRLCPPTSPNPTASTFSGFDLRTQACGKTLADAGQLTGLPYAVIIGTTVKYGPSTPGEYTIVSRGYGPGRAQRLVSAKVRIQGGGAAPLAFQGNTVRFTGQTDMDGQSIFARGCVFKRDMLKMTGTDAFGLPAAVHAEGAITEDQESTANCLSPSPSKAIHTASTPCNTTASHPDYKFDQDPRGGALPTGSPCLPTAVGLAAKYYANGSRLSPGDLQTVYSIKHPPLSTEEIDNLKAIAQSQGNYRTTGGVVTPIGDNAVLFYENVADINLNDIQGFRNTATCANHSLLIVVKGGNVTWTANSSNALIASVMVVTEDKQFLANGGGIIGSVYADKIVLGGSAIVSGVARDCAATNPSPSLLDFSVLSYREIDS